MNYVTFLLDVTSAEGVTEAPDFSITLASVLVVGFLAAVSIGSIAWYNSKRPAGWENKERPDIVPNIDK